MLVVKVHWELLPMACPRQNQQEVLAENWTVRKKQDPQE